jgi:hypothetical protein
MLRLQEGKDVDQTIDPVTMFETMKANSLNRFSA